MKKLYALGMALSIFAIVTAQPFTSTWQKLANATDYTWFTANGNDVNSIDYNPATDKLLVAKRSSAIYVINAATGAQEGTLVVPSTLDTYRFSKVRVTSAGVIYAISLATGAGSCYIWRWADQAAVPTLCATITCTERCGDSFGLSGTGTNTILYASGAGTTSNAFNIYMLNTFNGINFFVESKITMTSSPTTNQQWANRAIDPVSNSLTSDLWINGGGFPARKISVGPVSSGVRSGTLVTSVVDGVGNGQASVGYGGMRFVTSPMGNKYLIFSGGNNSYAGTKMKMINVTDELNPTTYGIDSLGAPEAYVTNANGTGDAAYKFEGDGYTVFYVSTNNGLEATRASDQELPITLGNFSATIRNKSVLIEWNTLTEANNAGFSVEKSIDGINFSQVAYVRTKAINGNSATQLNYQLEDAKLLTGKSFYRLKQVDKDGKASYSSIRNVLNANGLNLLSATILTNPVQDNLAINIKSPATKSVVITITNATGAILLNMQKIVTTGENNLSLSLSNIPTGLFMVTIKDTDNNQKPIVYKVLKN
ncbi:MAG: T9SS type A sorting domain-containing protein [Chitinophagaceae bacterium]